MSFKRSIVACVVSAMALSTCGIGNAKPSKEISEACDMMGTFAQSTYDLKQKNIPLDMALTVALPPARAQRLPEMEAIVTTVVTGVYANEALSRDQIRRFYVITCIDGMEARK